MPSPRSLTLARRLALPRNLAVQGAEGAMMKTLDLAKQQITVDELSRSASEETLQIRSREGLTFVLEATADFEREVAELGASERFMSLLAERSKEKGAFTLNEIGQRLALEDR